MNRTAHDEHDGLGRVLREWSVPDPPVEIEHELRRRFSRRNRSSRQMIGWMVAAALVGAVLHGLTLRRPTTEPAVTTTPAPSLTPTAGTPRHVPRAPALDGGRRRTATARAATHRRVVVEDRQAELALQFAALMRELHEAPPTPGSRLVDRRPTSARALVAPIGAAWETVGTEWPSVQRPLGEGEEWFDE